MIACDNNDCDTEWFHFGCVGLEAKPKVSACRAALRCRLLTAAAAGEVVLQDLSSAVQGQLGRGCGKGVCAARVLR